MQKLGLSAMKSLERFKSPSATGGGSSSRDSPKPFSFAARQSSESLTIGSFANLKMAAERLVKEQASVKTDLEMANSKLKKSVEHIGLLEGKLQNAFNENAKLKVKQTEDEKLWRGLESKYSSTKNLCDQLAETLQLLAGQIEDAEKDKKFFEEKLLGSSVAIDNLNQQMSSLSMKLEEADVAVKKRDKEVEDLKVQISQREQFHQDEKQKMASLIEEKETIIKEIESKSQSDALALESLTSKLGEVGVQLRSKEDEIKLLDGSRHSLEKEKGDLESKNDQLANKLTLMAQEIKDLEKFAHQAATQLNELDRQSLVYCSDFEQLNNLNSSFFELFHEKMELIAKNSRERYMKLHEEFLSLFSERDALQLKNQELIFKIAEHQKGQELTTKEHLKERHLAEERIQKLESEVDILYAKKHEAELLISKQSEDILTFLEKSKFDKDKMQGLLLEISALKTEKRDSAEKFQAEIQKRSEELIVLQKVIEENGHYAESMQKQLHEIQRDLEDKDMSLLKYKEREKLLEGQIASVQESMTATESRLAESKKQYDIMLGSKEMELSRHLKELSQRNDNAINDIRRKYDVEKQDIIDKEKEKVDKIIQEMEKKCDEKLAVCREESRQYLLRTQEEHATLVCQIQQENARNESALKASHIEDLKRAQLLAENDFREKTTSLRNDHEARLKAVTSQYEDECSRLREELDLQKSKEDRQRALLQLQWKVMSDKPSEDQEVSSRKVGKSGDSKRSQHALEMETHEQGKDSPHPDASQTPMSKLLKRVESGNAGSVINIPKHSKKVTHREYEVETSNGMITKRRKTKSTVMIENPRKNKKISSRVSTPRNVKDNLKDRLGSPTFSLAKDVKGSKGAPPQRTSNIGDLFSEGSLNPYAEDPYAFD
ncbi:hypothetical protein MLD38_010781 [Melastoma candidum]|uniref:Uncharacterized protein n=1 Tax=Melastoma candidum TaxID=119954 RepID=A0ACB9R0Y5_9MYRT|nr:hypothetical protein MLD38_010781 [Melastoma candidum]